MSTFSSPKGEIPEIDPNKLDLIISLLTTFESNDLHTKNAINFRYDKERDYVFLEMLSIHNGMKLVDYVFGYDKEKILNVCKNILSYFGENTEK
jgi:hypothetical protein